MEKPMTFACMAEAVAHFYNQGYVYLNEGADGARRVMVKDDGTTLAPMVELMKVAFLTVEARYL
jgi:hypothetical protein